MIVRVVFVIGNMTLFLILRRGGYFLADFVGMERYF